MKVRETMEDILNGERWRVDEGDCLTWLRSQKTASVDCCVTSPPYNTLNTNKQARTYRPGDKWMKKTREGYADTMPEDDYQEWLCAVVREALRVTNGLVWVNHKTRYRNGVGIHPLHILKDFPLWAEVVWDKCGATTFNQRRFATSNEYLFAFGRPRFWDPSNDGLLSVWRIAQDTNTEHPCPFPERIVEPLVAASCPPDGIVIDPFTGSGTTGAVALRLGRRFLGCELNPEYVAMSRNRIANYHVRPVHPVAADDEHQTTLFDL